ncbi:MAG TPA: 5-dehydro-4-deoxy-D-glucuronate isomerase [Gemmatimonadaceae bacterium]|nr:5-dehydro-4-deoxy-D-glucuronate isomerase [Gemmatimonadaceae bacterium]
MRYFPTSSQAKALGTDELRAAFLVTDLFKPDELTLHMTDLDRAVVGGAMPVSGSVDLTTPKALRAEYFTERRELGVLNIGGNGSVTVAGETHSLSARDGVYIGRGSRDVSFASDDSSRPARFYLISYPAHASFPTTLVRAADAAANELGSAERANRRRIARYIHAEGVRSAQLVMGVTVLESGSVWNTMPPHTHSRRSEIYLYFDVPSDAAVVHLMGEPSEIRALFVRDGEAALSPGWSIHAGCGTSSYAFCWAMGGENQDYADMDPVSVETLR